MAHGRTCAFSLRDPSTCECECGGSLHGSAWVPTAGGPSRAREVPPRQRKVRRAIGFVLTVAVAGTVGGLAINGNFSSSSDDDASSAISVQVSVDINKTISELSSLGFGGKRTSTAATSASSYSTDCSQNATGLVKEFLTQHPCKQYTVETWTVTQQDKTTQVAFSWVEMPTTSLASQYKAEVDTYKTGNPPGVSPATFNGKCYASKQQDSTVWAVEVNPTKDIKFNQEILQAAAQESLSPAYLKIHCGK